MSDEVVRQVLYPFQHQAQLANAVTSFATCLGGIMPLLYCWLGKRQPGRWMFAYLCVFITGIPTVWMHSYEGNRIAGFCDIGTNILLAWAIEVAVSGDFMGKKSRRRLLGVLTGVNALVIARLAYEITVPVRVPVIRFGSFGEFYFGEAALILNAFVVLGLFVASYRTIPRHARPLLHVVVIIFLMGLVLASASNSQITCRVLAWHATWHIDGAMGFITLWFFNHVRFNEPAG